MDRDQGLTQRGSGWLYRHTNARLLGLLSLNYLSLLDTGGGEGAAALRDLLFSWWEERFLLAHAGAPAIEKA